MSETAKLGKVTLNNSMSMIAVYCLLLQFEINLIPGSLDIPKKLVQILKNAK